MDSEISTCQRLRCVVCGEPSTVITQNGAQSCGHPACLAYHYDALSESAGFDLRAAVGAEWDRCQSRVWAT